MIEEVKINKPLLICPACHGYGRVEQQTCSLCQGRGVGLWLDKKFVFWGRQISLLTLAFDRIKSLIRNLINGFLVLLSALGILAFGWRLLEALNAGQNLISIFITPHPFVGLFWFSLLIDIYIYYRFERQMTDYLPVLRRDFTRDNLPDSYLFDWDLLKKLPGRQIAEISNSFDYEALAALDRAFAFAKKFNQPDIRAIHLLVALLAAPRIGNIFGRLGVNYRDLKEKVARSLRSLPPSAEQEQGLTLEIKRLLLLAYFNAWENHRTRVGLNELLVAISLEDTLAKEVLVDLKIDEDKLKNVVIWAEVQRQLWENWQHFRYRSRFKPNSKMNRSMTAIATPILDSFGQDITLLAQSHYLEPCVDRQEEINEIFRLIESGRKSAILVGNPGVGKTTIIEGIAQKMVLEDVPEILRDKRLVSLSIARLVAGATAAEAQERLMMGLREMAIAGNIILYIKDIHGMIGITAGGKESIDLAGTLVAALRQHHSFCLASSTPQEYGRYIEPHGSLGEFLNKVEIREPERNMAIQILEAKAPLIESREKVFFTYEAIEEAVRLSERYIHDRYLPQKAILLLEEVAVYVRKERGQNALVIGSDIAKLVSEKTKINVNTVSAAESDKLLHLEEIIHQRLVDQEEAVKAVATSLRRARAELRDLKKPIANLLFLGPTGVGKTELAKTIAEIYFGGEQEMLRLDMSEYQTPDSIKLLIGGLPTGEEAVSGYLTEGVRKNPYNVVLLDEFEKAHPDVLNLFLQVMDDGRLTDSSGRTIDFTNVILIATSNAGTQVIQDELRRGATVAEVKTTLMEQELKKYFKPELLNRFDNIVVFKPLAFADVIAITKLLLKQLGKRLAEKGISLEVTEAAAVELATAGYDPLFGARPLRRVINERVEDTLANYLLSNKLERRDTVVLDAGGRITINKAKEL